MTEQDTGHHLPTQAEAATRRLEEADPPPVPAVRDDGPLMAAIQKAASDPNFDVEKLRALREIQRDWRAEQAKIAYDEALARAQAAMPIVPKRSHVYFKPDGKAPTDYWYADYGDLVRAVKPALTAEGFSFDHKTEQDVTGDGMKITVTCTLKRGGHSESVTMFAPPEGSPGMNMIQKIRSTTKYLQRATLEQVCGAATEDEDDDGRNASASAVGHEVDGMMPVTHPDAAMMDSWKQWGTRMAETIKQADTQDALNAIWDDNKDAFANCEGSAPKIHERLVKRTEERAVELMETAAPAF